MLSRCVIAFTGAQGVGKTTLVRAIGAHSSIELFGPCSVHCGIGQHVAQQGVPLGELAHDATIMEFARCHIKRERMLSGGFHLLDRCFVDLLAYTRVKCSAQPSLVRLIEELAQASLANIQLVVRIPMIESLRFASASHESQQLREVIDKTIGEIICEFQLNSLIVAGSPQERADQVVVRIHELLGEEKG